MAIIGENMPAIGQVNEKRGSLSLRVVKSSVMLAPRTITTGEGPKTKFLYHPRYLATDLEKEKLRSAFSKPAREGGGVGLSFRNTRREWNTKKRENFDEKARKKGKKTLDSGAEHERETMGGKAKVKKPGGKSQRVPPSRRGPGGS